MPSTLFTTRPKDDPSPARHTEDTFAFLDRSSRLSSVRVRELLENWFAAYPGIEQRRLRHAIATDFHTGAFELFLHALFTAAGFEVTLHPSVPSARSKPDFLLSKPGLAFYAEATVVRDASDEERARRNVENELYDAINQVHSPNFFLALRHFVIAPGGQPAARRIRAFLERELRKHDPATVSHFLAAHPGHEGPTLTFQDSVLTMRITLTPKSQELRGRRGVRPLGIYPAKSRWGSAAPAIRKSVARKARQYGALDRPFITCVNCVSEWGWDQDDAIDALFGTEQVTVSPDDRDGSWSRARDGALMGPNGPQNTRVSAVMVGAVYPWALPNCPVAIYHNPWSSESLPKATLPLREAHVVDGRLQWSPAVGLQSVFGLPDGWPDHPAA